MSGLPTYWMKLRRLRVRDALKKLGLVKMDKPGFYRCCRKIAISLIL